MAPWPQAHGTSISSDSGCGLEPRHGGFARAHHSCFQRTWDWGPLCFQHRAPRTPLLVSRTHPINRIMAGSDHSDTKIPLLTPHPHTCLSNCLTEHKARINPSSRRETLSGDGKKVRSGGRWETQGGGRPPLRALLPHADIVPPRCTQRSQAPTDDS